MNSAGIVKSFHPENAITENNLTLNQRAILLVIGQICNSPTHAFSSVPINPERISKKLNTGRMPMPLVTIKGVLEVLINFELIENTPQKHKGFGASNISYNITEKGNRLYKQLLNDIQVMRTPIDKRAPVLKN